MASKNEKIEYNHKFLSDLRRLCSRVQGLDEFKRLEMIRNIFPLLQDEIDKLFYRKCTNCKSSHHHKELDRYGLCPDCLKHYPLECNNIKNRFNVNEKLLPLEIK